MLILRDLRVLRGRQILSKDRGKDRIEDDSRKDAKGAKFGKEGKIGEKMTLAKAPFDGLRVVSKVEPQRTPRKRIEKVFFAVLAPWRDEEKIG